MEEKNTEPRRRAEQKETTEQVVVVKKSEVTDLDILRKLLLFILGGVVVGIAVNGFDLYTETIDSYRVTNAEVFVMYVKLHFRLMLMLAVTIVAYFLDRILS